MYKILSMENKSINKRKHKNKLEVIYQFKKKKTLKLKSYYIFYL